MQSNEQKQIKSIRGRFKVIYILLALFAAVILAQLLNLQVSNGQQYIESAQSSSSKTRTLTGNRGNIYDAKGVVLAYDETSYNITFYREPGSNNKEMRTLYSQGILKAINIIEGEGGKVIDDFSVNKDAIGTWYLDFSTENQSVFDQREEQWRKNFYITDTEKYPVEVLFDTLCSWYCVPEESDYETKHKIMSVWQEMQMNSFLGNPIKIAENVDFVTVAKISAQSHELYGIEVEESTKRVYPLDYVAAHIVGYTGKMQSEETIKEYKEKGYSSDDYIGITGVEKTMEDQLSPNLIIRHGAQTVETDAYGRATQVLEYKAPTDGNSVMLTIDLEFQQVVEQALENNIEETRLLQIDTYNADPEHYDELVEARGGSEIKYAETGCAVVVDVNNCDVLALASYPSYPLSWFADGITTEQYQSLLEDTRAPLFNKAISSRETPGSIYKMVTALAGLEEGVIEPDTIINDDGRYKKYDSVNGPKCWTKYPEQHQNQTVLEGIKNSCNYFFYEVADRLGIDLLRDWTTRLGLNVKTNIELTGESTGIVGSQATLYDPMKDIRRQSVTTAITVSNQIKSLLVKTGEELGITYEEERLDAVVKSILDLATSYTKNESYEHIRNILLDEMGLTGSDISSRYMVNAIASYLDNLRWTPTQTIMTGIGQSITQLTPIAVARYIAAIANGGTVYDVHSVDKIVGPDGEIVSEVEPTVYSELTGIEDSLKIIRDGMHGVTSQEDRGTASKYFTNYKYTDQLGAKTGTAQVSKIDLENHSWFVAYAPFDEPEIAVVVFIPNGYSGASSAPAIKDIIEYYLDKKAAGDTDGIYSQGQLIP